MSKYFSKNNRIHGKSENAKISGLIVILSIKVIGKKFKNERDINIFFVEN